MKLSRKCVSMAAALMFVAIAAPSVARADAVTDWNVHASTAIFATSPTAHGSTQYFAIVHGAMYDAVNSIAADTYEPSWERGRCQPGRLARRYRGDGSVKTLVWLFPSQEGTLQTKYDASLALISQAWRSCRGSPPATPQRRR